MSFDTTDECDWQTDGMAYIANEDIFLNTQTLTRNQKNPLNLSISGIKAMVKTSY